MGVANCCKLHGQVREDKEMWKSQAGQASVFSTRTYICCFADAAAVSTNDIALTVTQAGSCAQELVPRLRCSGGRRPHVASLTGPAVISHQRSLSIAGKHSANSFSRNNRGKHNYMGLKT